MPVLVRNELNDPWVFEGSRGSRQLASGEVGLISDEEWAGVISAKRGPGGMNPLWPTNVTSDSMLNQFEYEVVGTDYEVSFIGYAPQGTLDTDATWTIKRFEYITPGDTNLVSRIQIFNDVAWVDRASLPWMA